MRWRLESVFDLYRSYGKRWDKPVLEEGMKEPYIEGVAIHGGPSDALAFREGAAKRSQGYV
jgi:hypothetical protein